MGRKKSIDEASDKSKPKTCNLNDKFSQVKDIYGSPKSDDKSKNGDKKDIKKEPKPEGKNFKLENKKEVKLTTKKESPRSPVLGPLKLTKHPSPKLEKKSESSQNLNLTTKVAKDKVRQIKAEIMARADTIAAKQSEATGEQFPFKPKMSLTSSKIAESLGEDFMARQQKHIEKQKKYMEQAAAQHRNIESTFSKPVSLSPVTNRKNKQSKESDAVNSKSDDESKESAEKVKRSATLHNIRPSKSNNSVAGLQRLENSPYNADVKKQRNQLASLNKSAPVAASFSDSDGGEDSPLPVQKSETYVRPFFKRLKTREFSSTYYDEPIHISHSRSKTMPPSGGKSKNAMINVERVKNAKTVAERAIKNRKIFTIQGPYKVVRECLRRRGWVEKFYNPAKAAPKKTPKPKKIRQSKDDDNDNDDDDDDDDVNDDDQGDNNFNDVAQTENTVPPWAEDDGIYGIMSRMVRNCSPSFIWCLHRDAVDFRFLSRDQVVNHYVRAGSFTTKIGLCHNLRNVHWFDNVDVDSFFPRCYRLSLDEDKAAFVDDFRLTSCMNVIRYVTQSKCSPDDDASTIVSENQSEQSKPNASASKCKSNATGSKEKASGKKVEPPVPESVSPQDSPKKTPRNKPPPVVPEAAIDVALRQCMAWLKHRNHEDIDNFDESHILSDAQWDQMIQWSYLLRKEGATVQNAEGRYDECATIAKKLRKKNPQFESDGYRNVWIVKPGAKSRGRGIVVMDKLSEMLSLVSSSVKQDGKYVVQKYIERPLLINNLKFDIRQWFLVTDWNPLTVYFYKNCYLRFCSQPYTLSSFHETIHLANNAIQKNFVEQLMWDGDEFKDWLNGVGAPTQWDNVIYPGMKKAVICSLLCTQDIVEYRKSSFELYGADFMITEDLKPWLIEINSSPSMCRNTPVTNRLCTSVLDDTLKVTIDRKFDRNCDIGLFELAYKQTQVTVPPYIGLNLSVEGSGIKRPGFQNNFRRSSVIPVINSQSDENVNNNGAPNVSPYTAPAPRVPNVVSQPPSLRFYNRNGNSKSPPNSVNKSKEVSSEEKGRALTTISEGKEKEKTTLQPSNAESCDLKQLKPGFLRKSNPTYSIKLSKPKRITLGSVHKLPVIKTQLI